MTKKFVCLFFHEYNLGLRTTKKRYLFWNIKMKVIKKSSISQRPTLKLIIFRVNLEKKNYYSCKHLFVIVNLELDNKRKRKVILFCVCVCVGCNKLKVLLVKENFFILVVDVVVFYWLIDRLTCSRSKIIFTTMFNSNYIIIFFSF